MLLEFWKKKDSFYFRYFIENLIDNLKLQFEATTIVYFGSSD